MQVLFLNFNAPFQFLKNKFWTFCKLAEYLNEWLQWHPVKNVPQYGFPSQSH